jgi:hypothetical protein
LKLNAYWRLNMNNVAPPTHTNTNSFLIAKQFLFFCKTFDHLLFKYNTVANET